jgi:hypothetical protein
VHSGLQFAKTLQTSPPSVLFSLVADNRQWVGLVIEDSV